MKPSLRGCGAWALNFRRLLCQAVLFCSAATCWPDGTVTECTDAALRSAMAGGGTVLIACDGTIGLTNRLEGTLPTTLDATGWQVALSGLNSTSVFYVASNVTFAVRGLVITGGHSASGSAILNDGAVYLSNVSFLSNTASNAAPTAASGGAILNRSGIVRATNCVFRANSACQATNATGPALGGAICSLGGSVTLDRCAFESCSSSGSEHNASDSTSGSAGQGGAIYNEGELQVYQCSFTWNTATGGAGSIGMNGCGPFLGCPGGNGGDALGGAVFNAGLIRLERSLFASNSVLAATGGTGGPGYHPLPDFGWPGGYGGNGGSGLGGAFFNAGLASLVNCTFVGNTGTAGNGGQGGSGAGIGPAGSPGSAAGGICDTNGLLNMTNCTVCWCSAPASPGPVSGGIKASGTRLVNTLLAYNVPGGNCSGNILDGGHNLSSDATCAFTATSSLNSVAPKLVALANNGGPTSTVALQPDSPALDAGDSAATPVDQRGFPRPVGAGADIGAFEFGSPAFLKCRASPGGGVDITVYGVSGQQFIMLTSSDCADWLPIATNQFTASGSTDLHQSAQTSPAFFRALLP